MHVLIIADMEGVAGIETYAACDRSAPDYVAGQALLGAEVRRIAAAARAAGASQVSVIDWHGGGGNLNADLLDDGTAIVAEDFSPGYDVVLLSGFHAMAGTQNAFISHTMSQAVTLEVNGKQHGELALLSRWAGEEGVPVALVTGDEAAVTEAASFLPHTAAVALKHAVSWEQADCLQLDEAYALLDEAVSSAISNRDRWRVYTNERPLQLRIKLNPEPPMVAKIPWLTRDDQGWLTGEVENTKAVIDLIDLCTALR